MDDERLKEWSARMAEYAGALGRRIAVLEGDVGTLRGLLGAGFENSSVSDQLRAQTQFAVGTDRLVSELGGRVHRAELDVAKAVRALRETQV